VKHKILTSIAHNIADSLASGIGLMIGVYEMDIFGEAARSPEGFIEVDFLTGATHGGAPSRSLAKAISLYADTLPGFCQKQDVSISDYDKLTARYSGHWPHQYVVVEVRDRNGKTSTDTYVGAPLARPKVLDPLGRIRRLKSA
jgi:hypothetical protein